MVFKKVLIVLLVLSPFVCGDTTTFVPNTKKNSDEESFADETLSFGIKSFTFEVTKPTAKPLNTSQLVHTDVNDGDINLQRSETVDQSRANYLSTSSNVEQFHVTELQPSSTETTFVPETVSVTTYQQPFTSSILESDEKRVTVHSATEMRTESEVEQESTDERPPPSSSIFPSVTLTISNSAEYYSTTQQPMINDIYVEKKLENGLYRIKLAEIVTDEFNGISSNGGDVSSIPHENLHNTHSQSSKINIVDLYPSKLEDFGPIIRDSNEKMIRDKQALLNDDGNTFSNSLSDLFEADKNIPTSKIEIELIDGNENSQKSVDSTNKITDLTGKLQEQDGVITEIEKKFRLDDLKPLKEITQKPVTVNQKIEFIDRRVKKSFDYSLNHFGRFGRVDFANTKFNTEPIKKDENDTHTRQGDKPEFSTTKFYNSKELYNEMLHKKVNSDVSVKTLTTDPALISTTVNTKEITDSHTEGDNKTVLEEKELTRDSSLEIPVEKHTSTIMPQTSSEKSELKMEVTNPKPVSTIKPEVVSQKMIYITPSPPSTVFTSSTSEKLISDDDDKNTDLKISQTSKIIDAISTVPTVPEFSRTITSTVENTENINTTSPSQSLLKSVASNTNSMAKTRKTFSRTRVLTRLQEKINLLECDIQNLPQDSHVWRGNETHELLLPITSPADCKTNEDCSPMIISWEGQAEIQSGDVLLVEINDALLTPLDYNQTQSNISHKATTTVYQVTRLGHEHCDVTEGVLLDITPLVVDGRKLVTLYDKDLTEGVNLLIVVSELWGSQCVRLKVTVKSDNCGENADCSGKGVCFSNASMEGYECQCCQGFAGSHCEEIDACSPSPCTNNGICVDLSQGHEGNSYQCLCPYGYTGKICQYESDPCNPAECLNGGSCVGNSTHFRCDCAPGYTGLLCQHNLNECESSPCVHGICVDQEDGFRCFCQPGFAGELCSFEYNECESNPCLNGGQCMDQIGGYECKCTRGFTGNQCHVKVDFCANGPCPEGHRCIDRGDDFTCECPSGRNGPDCIQSPRALCNVNPCANGGTCWTSEDSFYCACRPGYTGKMCEDEFIVETVVSSSEFMIDDSSARSSFSDKAFGATVPKSPIELHNAYIAAGTLAAAIFIVAVVVTICHCKVNQTYRRFSTRHHQLIPIFGFGRRSKSPKSHRHWLSGKSGGGGGGSGNPGVKSNKGHLPGTGSSQCFNHHIPPTSHHHHPHQVPDRPFQRHLAMNLENDMYYTVDFSDSQHSPLIQ